MKVHTSLLWPTLIPSPCFREAGRGVIYTSLFRVHRPRLRHRTLHRVHKSPPGADDSSSSARHDSCTAGFCVWTIIHPDPSPGLVPALHARISSSFSSFPLRPSYLIPSSPLSVLAIYYRPVHVCMNVCTTLNITTTYLRDPFEYGEHTAPDFEGIEQ